MWRRTWLLGGALSLAAGALVLAVLVWSRSAEPVRPPFAREATVMTAPIEDQPVVAVAVAVPAAPAGAGSTEPHPITPERLRIDEQHQLFDRVEAAIEARDFSRARVLLREHEARFPEPEAWTDLREGWQVITECLERPGPGSRSGAQEFVDRERGSSLRRRVRRTCLEGSE